MFGLDQVEAFFALKDRWTRWQRSRGSQSEESIVGRFLRLFETHGVHRNQIPRFFGHGLTLRHVQTESALIEQLDEPVLGAACELFGVQREWLDGASDQVYDCHNFYKRPEDFVAFMEALLGRQSASEISGALVFPERPSRDAEAVLLLEETIGTLDDRQIIRFHVCNGWIYEYWKCRGYLAACVAIAWRQDVYIHGRYAPTREIARVASGKMLLGWKGEGLLGFGRGRWAAEDLALKPSALLLGVDPERDRFGLRAALGLWLDLDSQGFMKTGLPEIGVRERFLAERARY